MEIMSFNDYMQIMREGVFVGIKVKDTRIIYDIADKIGLTELHADLHVTLVYSKGVGVAPVPIKHAGFIDAAITGVELFGDEQDCLVLTLDGDDLQRRHQELLNSGLTHTYPEYNPHITLSYSWEGDKPNVNSWEGARIRLHEEYFEPINNNYIEDNSHKD